MKILFIYHAAGGAYLVERHLEEAFSDYGVGVHPLPYYDSICNLESALYRDPNFATQKLFLGDYINQLAGSEILVTAEQLKPDFIFTLNGDLISPQVLAILKKLGHKIVTWQVDDPYIVDAVTPLAKYFDYMFTVDTSTLEIYKKDCPRVYYLPLACNPKLHRKIEVEGKYLSDFCFIGTPFKNSTRLKILESLVETFGESYRLLVGGSFVIKEVWENFKYFERLRNNIIGEIVNREETVKYYNGAKINLNLHRGSLGSVLDKNENQIIARSPCERTFVLAGCGAFQLMDNTRPDLPLSFKVDKEIVMFSDIEELKQKAEYYLNHPLEREKIGSAAQARAYAEHTYSLRVKKILETVKS